MKYTEIKHELQSRFDDVRRERQYDNVLSATAAAVYQIKNKHSNLDNITDREKIELFNSIITNSK